MIRTEGELLDEDDKPIVEEHELWLRDPVECIRELIGNPAFREYMAYAPEKTYTDKYGRNRRYDEMWTGDWWWTTQVSQVHYFVKLNLCITSRQDFHQGQLLHLLSLHLIRRGFRNSEAISKPGLCT
jgi:hypothetical protein